MYRTADHIVQLLSGKSVFYKSALVHKGRDDPYVLLPILLRIA